MDENLNLVEVYRILKKRIKFILLTIILSVVTVMSLTLLASPVYEATTQILVNQASASDDGLYYHEVKSNLQLINTYRIIVESPFILEDVAAELDNSMSVAELQESITVSNKSNSSVINISVQSESSDEATEIASTIAVVFQENISEIMDIESVVILSTPKMGEKITPSTAEYAFIGLTIGVFLGVMISVVSAKRDTSIKNEEDIKLATNLPVLGIVSSFDAQN